AVELHVAGGPVARVKRVHAVEYPQQRRLAAARGADEGGDPPVGQDQADVLERLDVAVVEVEMAHIELDRAGSLRHGRRRPGLHYGGGPQSRLPPGLNDTTTRALMLRIRMLSVMISAPDQASCCQFGYGLRANWKITTGRFAIGALRLVLQNWLLSAVKSSGAVSPLIRATASSSPVRMPLRAAG